MENHKLSEYRKVAIDLPGHGAGVKLGNTANYTCEIICDALRHTIEKVAAENSYLLVASSLGTNLVSEILSSLKNCKGYLALGSCMVGEGVGLEKVFQNNPNSAAVFMEAPTEEQLRNLIRDSVTTTSEALIDSIFQDFLNTDKTFRTAVAALLAPGVLSDEIKTMAGTKIPVAIAFGKDEKLCQTNYLDFMSDKFWQKKVHLISGAGHLCHIDQPEHTAELLSQFATDCFRE